MKPRKPSPIIYNLVKLGLFIVLIVFIIIFRNHIIESWHKFFIGGIMLMYGIEEIFFEAIFSGKSFLKKSKVYLGFVEILLGIALLLGPFELASVCVIWATWSILREAFEVKEIVTEIKCITPRVFSGIESIIVIIFSVLLLFDPGEHHAMTHLYLLCVELVFFCLTPLLDYLILKFVYKKEIEQHEEE